MHGLALRAVQLFVTSLYGDVVWRDIMRTSGTDFVDFECAETYSDTLYRKTLCSVGKVLQRPMPDLQEDLGTFLVSNPALEPVRRLLRFGGDTFDEFLASLDDMPDRARVAFPDFEWPVIELRAHTTCHYSVICHSEIRGMGHVLVGLLRTMADDYGALAVVEYRGGGQGTETLGVTLLEPSYSDGRTFLLGAISE